MADKYISREAAIDIAMQYCPDDDRVCSKADADLREMLDEIETIPAADVRPVVHARWEDIEVRFEDELKKNPVTAVASMFCPNCKRWHNEVYFYGNPVEMARFCGFCGADMREGNDGSN